MDEENNSRYIKKRNKRIFVEVEDDIVFIKTKRLRTKEEMSGVINKERILEHEVYFTSETFNLIIGLFLSCINSNLVFQYKIEDGTNNISIGKVDESLKEILNVD